MRPRRIWDPDPPQKPMTETERKRFAEDAARLLAKARKEDPQGGPPPDEEAWFLRKR